MLSITRYLLSHQLTRPAIRPSGSGYLIRETKAIVVHWTANTKKGANALANRSYFNQGFRAASAHYIVDSNTILQCIPENEVAFHCGDKPEGRYRPAGLDMIKGTRLTPNYFTIGVELCVNADGDWRLTCLHAAALCARLLIRHNLPPEKLLRHFDVTGKRCPQPMLNTSDWLGFKRLVIEEWVKLQAQSPHNATVNADGLNVRTGPGVGFKILYGLTLGEPVTIFESNQNGWVRIGEAEWVNSKFLTKRI